MSGIFGIVALAPESPHDRDIEIRRMASAMARWGQDGIRCATLQSAWFGQAVTFDTPESSVECLPLTGPEQRLLFTAEGRLDNRDEVADRLGLPSPARRALADGELMFAAYRAWGPSTAVHFLGDWSFAAWHAHEQRLVLGRDHAGNTTLYYAQTGNQAAFASDIRSLLQLSWVPRQLNELRLAKFLVNWHRGQSDATFYAHIQQLPPGCTLQISRAGTAVSPYWSPANLSPIKLPTDAAYAEALRETLREAVRSRLRSHRPVGTTLSAGLDSGAVTALAAAEFERQGRRLPAFTVVPAREDFPVGSGTQLFNEAAAAGHLARCYASVEHVLVDCRPVTPIQGIRVRQAIHHIPIEANRNAAFIVRLLQSARDRDLGVLLTGQLGNLTMSWEAPPSLGQLLAGRRFRAAVSRVRWLKILKQTGGNLFRLLDPPWRGFSPINSTLADDVELLRHMRSEGHDGRLIRAQNESRAMEVFTAAGKIGVWAQAGAEFGLDVRDPSGDKRVIELALSAPLALWHGPLSRRLFREAMKGVLPDEIRLNTRRGVQSADTCERLADRADELRDALDEVETSALARRCIDLPYCRRIAATLRTPDRIGPLGLVDSVLLRGLEVGLFLAAVERGEPRVLAPVETDRVVPLTAGTARGAGSQ